MAITTVENIYKKGNKGKKKEEQKIKSDNFTGSNKKSPILLSQYCNNRQFDMAPKII